MREKGVTPVWCAVANIVRERPYGHGGVETRLGTKHFSPGTKVYIRNVYWGMGGEKLEVIGRHRGSSDVVTMSIPSAWLTNLRVKLAYEPRIIARLMVGGGGEPWDGTCASKARAERWAAEFTRRIAAFRGDLRALRKRGADGSWVKVAVDVGGEQ